MEAAFFALRPDGPSRSLTASVVLEGLAPGDVREAVEPVRLGRNVAERMQAVARIVRRRREASIQVREEDPPPCAGAGGRNLVGGLAAERREEA